MEKTELEEKLKEIQDKYELDRQTTIKEYCLSNNPYKIGDKFTDHIGSIIIESIEYSSMRLCCAYYGLELKKDGTPRKDGSKRRAWQSNEII